MDKIDIVILEHESETVSIIKADPQVVADNYDNNIERYIEECLGFKLSQVSWMCGTEISLKVYGGTPNGGMTMTTEDYWDA